MIVLVTPNTSNLYFDDTTKCFTDQTWRIGTYILNVLNMSNIGGNEQGE